MSIYFRFSEEVEVFQQIISLSYDKFSNKLFIKFPVLVYEGDFMNNSFLFKTDFTVETTLAKIKMYAKHFNSLLCEAFLNKFFPDVIKELTLKAVQWISFYEPLPVLLENNKSASGEFIEVNDATSFYGNFIQNNKEGCQLYYGENLHCKELDTFVYQPRLSSYGLNCDASNFDILSYKDKFNFIKNLGLDACLKYYKSLFEYNKNHEIDEYYCPYKVVLSGNDDDSWTRYFTTKELMMKEVYRLRRCQPIDKKIDVINNGYYFTN